MNIEELQKSSVRFYSLETFLSERDPFEVYRDDVGEKVFQTCVPWEHAPAVPTVLPDLNFVYDYEVKFRQRSGEQTLVAKGWFGISAENMGLQEALYIPAYYGDEIHHFNRGSTMILPAGSTVLGIELIKDVFYDLDHDRRFRNMIPSVLVSGERAEHELRGIFSGYGSCLKLMVRFRTRDGDERVVILNQPEQGDFMMPTRPYDYGDKMRQSEQAEYVDTAIGRISSDVFTRLSDPFLLE